MNNPGIILTTIGVLLILGLATDMIGRSTPLPRVTSLLLFGVAIGPSGLDLLPDFGEQWFATIANMALALVGFHLGERLTVAEFRKYGKLVFWISISVVLATTVAVLIGLSLLDVPIVIAMLLAGIAPATAPAAVSDVVHEARARGKFSGTLLGVVAIDDALGLIAFSFLLACTDALSGQGGASNVLLVALWELGGAVLIGMALGIPMSYLTGRIAPGESTLAEALGMVFLCGGIAISLNVSFLLAAMTMGACVSNWSRHRTRAFFALQSVEWPFMILFFMLAGAALELESLGEIGLIGSAYILLRVLGRLFGSRIGGSIGKQDSNTSWWMGIALMPQAGVALAMALVAKERYPVEGEIILPVVIGATVVFELIGPVLTREALVQVGEATR